MYYEKRPPLISVSKSGEKYHSTLNYLIEESGDGYEVASVTIATDGPLSEEHYGKLVSAIVRSRYSEDDTEAIICNYSLTPRSSVAKDEMNELQQWRAMAKERAKDAIEYVREGCGADQAEVR
ncbi:MAG: hypothetical protein IJ222_03330 [Bacteroidales bacterium]|nr:hypothetical protein [Bacteroidales bacterium]